MKWQFNDGTDDLEIILRGDFDMYDAATFASEAIARIGDGSRAVCIDFTQVAYLDSSGVGVIIHLLRTSRALGCGLSFRGIGGSPRKVLEMSNILPLLVEIDRT